SVSHEDGWLGAFSDPIEVRAGEVTSVADLVMRRNPNVISGIVFGPNGAPDRNVSVHYQQSGRQGPSADIWLGTYSDDRGNFLISAARAGSFDITLRGG